MNSQSLGDILSDVEGRRMVGGTVSVLNSDIAISELRL